jgi:hypothetical protein
VIDVWEQFFEPNFEPKGWLRTLPHSNWCIFRGSRLPWYLMRSRMVSTVVTLGVVPVLPKCLWDTPGLMETTRMMPG